MHGRTSIATAAAACALATISAPGGESASTANVKGPWLLTSLPGMGKVLWRCDPARARVGRPSLALTFSAFTSSATESLALTVGGRRVVARVVQPRQTVVLPYVGQSRQRVVVEQSIEPGTLRAVLVVEFRPRGPGLPSHCWPYLPPGFKLELFPR